MTTTSSLFSLRTRFPNSDHFLTFSKVKQSNNLNPPNTLSYPFRSKCIINSHIIQDSNKKTPEQMF